MTFDAPIAHRESHRALIPPLPQRRSASHGSLDAVVVPASREPRSLLPAARLATAAGVPLLVLCSRAATPADVVGELSEGGVGTDVTCLHVPAGSSMPALRLSMEDHPEHQWHDHGNAAVKRNIALAVARMLGWRQIVFVDDDIDGVDHGELGVAAGALRSPTARWRAVGWVAERFPDNSVVCHALRRCGGPQDTSVGSQALAIRLDAWVPIFPPVYNEDWLFLFDWIAAGAVALGGRVVQSPYDPFAEPERATREEFGDVLAEGLYELLHRRAGLAPARRPDYWSAVLDGRRALIERLLRELAPGDPAYASVRAARVKLQDVTATSLTRFVDAWRADLDRWNALLAAMPSLPSVLQAASYLGVDGVASRSAAR